MPDAVEVPVQQITGRAQMFRENSEGAVHVADRRREVVVLVESSDRANAKDVDGQADCHPKGQQEGTSAAGVLGGRCVGLGCVAGGCTHGNSVGMERGLLEGGSIGVG